MNISINNIEKSYDRQILKKVSYKFEAGKIYVIKGVSGCGKSTLLNIMGGVEQDYEGSVQYNDDICTCGKLRSLTGYVFQYSLLLSNITVLENLLLIKNDIKFIRKLSEEMSVLDLLQKYPEQLSGGERQRISIIRSLLQNPKILLMDEPTASLDEDNSKKIADMINGLKSEDKIIIVATHEHYFDEQADEIIHLTYGEIGQVYKNDGTKKTNSIGFVESFEYSEKTKKIKKSINALSYNIKRNKKLLSFFNLIPFAVMFLLIMIVSTLQNSFEGEYMNSIKKNYPVDAFNIWESELQAFAYKDKVKIYDFYIAQEDNIKAYYLADQKDSVLAIDGMIEFGNFPENEMEILVSYELIENIFEKKEDLGKYIGQKVDFMGEEFIISGILFPLNETERDMSANEKFSTYFNSDIYYQEMEGNIIFISYVKMKIIGTMIETQIKRAVYRGLYDDMDAVFNLRNAMISGSINVFDNEIKESQNMLDGITLILLFVFGVCFIISCIFMSSQIQIELFYRRKELGFLQIFGLKKKRIMTLVCAGYFIKVVAAFSLAMILYAGGIILYAAVAGHLVFFNSLHMIFVLTALLVFYFGSVYLSTYRFLRKDIIKLVTD